MSFEKLSFKEYHDNLAVTKESNIENGYGWFVDLEENTNTTINSNTNIIRRIKTSQYISIPETINEFPSIKSFSSVQSLDDSSIFFEMDDIKNDKNKPNIMTYTYINICGLIALMLYCIKLY